MRFCWTIASLALIALSAGCTSQTASKQPLPSIAAREPAQPLPEQSFQQPFQQPTVPPPVPVPNLIPPTNVPERLPEVSTGRPDPFSTLLMAPTIVSTNPAPSEPAVINPITVPSAPAVAVAPPPAGTLPTFQPGGITQMPSVPVAPVSVAEAIEISGVVQAGGKTSIILQVPNEHTSRYVGVGERLANGSVLVKRVEMGSEPIVILEQDGREITKSIGSLSSAFARRS
ncbi:hypothetical protein IFO70_04250 [Phormidium tenue FACHB-886]|nr:hypothetical protein [Phormidium tenue FACHB-886]